GHHHRLTQARRLRRRSRCADPAQDLYALGAGGGTASGGGTAGGHSHRHHRLPAARTCPSTPLGARPPGAVEGGARLVSVRKTGNGRLIRRSPVPLYSQVKELLRERIARLRGEEHEQLPSERELARDLNISRMTVRQAVRELIAEGAIYTAPGRGTFLVTGEVTQQLVGLTSFSQEMTKRGLVPASRLLEAEGMTDHEIAARLRLQPDEPIARIRRL